MKKIFVDKIEGEVVSLTNEEHRHLSLSLRSKVGDQVILSKGDEFKYICTITSITKNETLLKVIKKEKDLSEPDIDTSLYFCILKGEHNDFIVQKATELGVSKLIPVISQYSVAKSIKIERLNKIALEASKQCGRNKIPLVSDPIDFSTALKQILTSDIVLFPYEKENSLHIKEFLKNNLSLEVFSASIIVGAEGGFSKEEVDMLTDSGIKPVSLGNRILRAETACITALSCLMYESENL